ncbi:type VI secretion system Vgr family protein [Casimicrobium huifangae]|jgi:type VI secretion system secreted protein VgrG|uniref:type VI secretion system Vgr family protein n=1 Tax=Casimicrobium huifangae TaxID=2591109 RepID=UPI003784B7FD
MERLVDITTPFGDAVWFRQMTGTEALSVPFEFEVVLHSKQSGLSAKAALGKDFTLKVETEKSGSVRYFNGICTRFGSAGREGDHLVYVARLRPWLWLASRRSDCKIFQFKKVPDIITEVLARYGYPITKKLTKTYRQWDYCVQYQETDMNFVMRLMEHEGIYFSFEHAAGTHTLVMSDDMAAHPMLPIKPSIKYYGTDATTVADEEHFNSWLVREEVDSGEYFADDYDFEHPKADLKTKRSGPMGHSHDNYQHYEWPGGYVKHADGEAYAAERMDMLAAEHERTQGHTTVRTMAPGYRFNLERCPRKDQNREYLAVAATYFFRDNARMSSGSGEGDADWGIMVTSQPTTIPYKPQQLTPKPLTHGPQTAVVVGPKGEEIYTDKYGRVKVHFFWDRYDNKDENSSCWVRVSQPWAGDKWGFIHIPRIGQEVIVDFIGGDPDYPMITGRVYNADQMPPYGLPENKTASGIKSRSTKGGGPTDFNEIRMEDLKGKEQLYVHAQRNLDTVVEADESRMVGHDRATRIGHDDDRFVANDDRHVIKGNQSIQVEGNETFNVKSNQDTTVNGNQSNMVDGDRTQNIGGDLKEKTGGNHVETISSNHTVSVGGDESNSISGSQTNMVLGGRSTTVIGNDKTLIAGTASYSAARYNVMGATQYSETCMTRKATVMGTDTTKIVGMQTETIGGKRSAQIGGLDSTEVGGAHTLKVAGMSSTQVGGAISAQAGAAISFTAGAAVTISAGGAVTITSASVTITAGVINLVGVVNVAGMLNVAGVVTTTSLVSPLYTPGVGNMI